MILSVLICHIWERKKELQRLLDCLLPQMKAGSSCSESLPSYTFSYYSTENDEVEILLLSDERGGMSIGQKRNMLLRNEMTRGEYICFVDDDDLVSSDYIAKILTALKSKPEADVVGMEGVLKRNGWDDEPFFHSLKYDHWYSEGKRHFRNPNHLNPVRRELALQVGFPPDSSYGEDHWYSDKLLPLLKTEVMIEGCIYFYLK